MGPDELCGEQGRELLALLRDERVDADTELAVGTRLRRSYPADLVAAALAQHRLRLRGAEKFAHAAQMFFTRDGLEQASAEPVARHRAGRYAGRGRVADLCTGIGGDLIALAEVADEVLAVDRDPVALRMAGLNAAAYRVAQRVSPWLGDVRDADLSTVTAAFVDPARRSGGRRMPAGVSEPPLDWCTALADRVAAVGVKAAPGLPDAAVPAGWELEMIASRRELKEAVLWSPALATTRRRATILPEGHTLTSGPGEIVVDRREPGEYLLDPNPAVTRAGLVAELAGALGAWQIDRRIAFLCTDTPQHTPFARTLRVLESVPWHEKRLSARLRALDIGVLDIRRRGLAGDVATIQRRLRPRGNRPATLVMTRVDDRPWALICVDA